MTMRCSTLQDCLSSSCLVWLRLGGGGGSECWPAETRSVTLGADDDDWTSSRLRLVDRREVDDVVSSLQPFSCKAGPALFLVLAPALLLRLTPPRPAGVTAFRERFHPADAWTRRLGRVRQTRSQQVRRARSPPRTNRAIPSSFEIGRLMQRLHALLSSSYTSIKLQDELSDRRRARLGSSSVA